VQVRLVLHDRSIVPWTTRRKLPTERSSRDTRECISVVPTGAAAPPRSAAVPLQTWADLASSLSNDVERAPVREHLTWLVVTAVAGCAAGSNDAPAVDRNARSASTAAPVTPAPRTICKNGWCVRPGSFPPASVSEPQCWPLYDCNWTGCVAAAAGASVRAGEETDPMTYCPETGPQTACRQALWRRGTSCWASSDALAPPDFTCAWVDGRCQSAP